MREKLLPGVSHCHLPALYVEQNANVIRMGGAYPYVTLHDLPLYKHGLEVVGVTNYLREWSTYIY